MSPYKQIKEIHCKLALEIRTFRKEGRATVSKGAKTPSTYKDYKGIDRARDYDEKLMFEGRTKLEDAASLSWQFRHRHIAYCLIRGRTIEQIEPKVNYGRDNKLVTKYMDEYQSLLKGPKDENEAICHSQERPNPISNNCAIGTCGSSLPKTEPVLCLGEREPSDTRSSQSLSSGEPTNLLTQTKYLLRKLLGT